MTKLIYKVVLLVGILILTVSCRARVQVVERERMKVEHKDRLRLERDSIYLHDSVYITQRGDTIYRDRWRTHYRNVYVRDTTFIDKRDSIRIPVIVEVDKPRSWIQKMEMNLYRVVILLLVIYIGWRRLPKELWRRRQ